MISVCIVAGLFVYDFCHAYLSFLANVSFVHDFLLMIDVFFFTYCEAMSLKRSILILHEIVTHTNSICVASI